MKFGRTVISSIAVTGISGAAVLGLSGTAQASVLDRQQKSCGSALVTAKLERDSAEHEVDVEVYSERGGERWRIVIKNADGEVLRTVNRKTNREGEFDVWRSIPGTINDVTVDVRGPNGQDCTLQLRA